METPFREDVRWFDNKNLKAGILVFVAIASIWLATKAIVEIKNLVRDSDYYPSKTISVQGKGEVYAVADTALFSYSVMEKAATVKLAQDKATEKTNKAIKYLKDNGIEEKDIKTTGYYVNPQYEYTQPTACTQFYCPPGKQVLSGYEVNQSIEVKVRDTGKAGDLLTGIGEIGVSNVSGLQFTFDDEDKFIEEARKLAIEDAKEKAKRLGRDVGVRLGKIVSFDPGDNGGYPTPYYNKAMMADGRGGAIAESAPSPEIPQGENKIIIYVTLTYEMR